MEARQAVNATSVPAGLTAILAISVAASLAGAATVYLEDLGKSSAAVRSNFVVPSPAPNAPLASNIPPVGKPAAIDSRARRSTGNVSIAEEEGLVSVSPQANKVGGNRSE